MQKLAQVCIRRPVFASMLMLALVVVGAASYQKLGVDRLPSVDMPTVRISTRLPGASPTEIETEVSQQIEEAVNTVQGIRELRSVSGQGSSFVMVNFNLDRDIDDAAQDVRERVATVIRKLPREADPPEIAKFDNDLFPVMTIAVSGDRSLRELTEIADKMIKPQLERSPGVGEIDIVGGLERAISIWVNADRLAWGYSGSREICVRVGLRLGSFTASSAAKTIPSWKKLRSDARRLSTSRPTPKTSKSPGSPFSWMSRQAIDARRSSASPDAGSPSSSITKILFPGAASRILFNFSTAFSLWGQVSTCQK